MLIMTCDLCGQVIIDRNDAVTLDWKVLGVSAFPGSERHFHIKCAQKMKDYLDHRLTQEEERRKPPEVIKEIPVVGVKRSEHKCKYCNLRDRCDIKDQNAFTDDDFCSYFEKE